MFMVNITPTNSIKWNRLRHTRAIVPNGRQRCLCHMAHPIRVWTFKWKELNNKHFSTFKLVFQHSNLDKGENRWLSGHKMIRRVRNTIVSQTIWAWNGLKLRSNDGLLWQVRKRGRLTCTYCSTATWGQFQSIYGWTIHFLGHGEPTQVLSYTVIELYDWLATCWCGITSRFI